jgi:hypothetical protein
MRDTSRVEKQEDTRRDRGENSANFLPLPLASRPALYSFQPILPM